MDWASIIIAIIGALAGGGLISLLTIRETKKGLKLDNAEKEDSRWEKLANELQDQNEKLNDRIDKKDALLQEKDDVISDIRTKLDNSRTRCAMSEILKCVNINCQDREPKLGTRNLDIESIISDSKN